MQDIISTLGEFTSKNNIFPNEIIKEHTTMKIGGRVKAFVTPYSVDELVNVIKVFRDNNERFMLTGNASNLLFSDDDLDFYVVSTDCRGAVSLGISGEDKSGVKADENALNGVTLSEALFEELENIDLKLDTENKAYTFIKANAGAYLSNVASVAANHSLKGFEGLSGIPGTIGGAVVMNAGAYGAEVKDVIVAAKVLTGDGEIKLLNKEELKLSYRNSVILEAGYIVLTGYFALEKGDKEEITALMKELNFKRRDKQPLEYPSCGSTFKRPEGAFAAKLIEDSGLKGYRVGDMMISDKHAGFMINAGNGTFKDAIKVMEDVKEKVKADSGFVLEPEVKIIKG
ncbi:MAG: UDP-N-acetylmuramate dehydrogenase [Lachnospiraceae bacterium]|nr:UDP-N-acetylmuramate dehydrogenase [Lachnospiraceae bacterium]